MRHRLSLFRLLPHTRCCALFAAALVIGLGVACTPTGDSAVPGETPAKDGGSSDGGPAAPSEVTDASWIVGEWHVTRIGDAVVSSAHPPVLSFHQDGRLSGTTGGNRLTSMYLLAHGSLSVGPVATTKRMPPPEIAEQERALLRAMEHLVSATLGDDGTMLLSADRGEGVIEAKRAGDAAVIATERALQGTVIYRERSLLRPGHTLVVQLEDVSRADAPAVVLGRVSSPISGTPPFAFSVAYDSSKIADQFTYALRASIHDADDKLLWTNTSTVPVLTRDAPQNNVEILVSPVGR